MLYKMSSTGSIRKKAGGRKLEMQTVVFRLSQSESKIYKLCFSAPEYQIDSALCSRENRHPERQSGLQGGMAVDFPVVPQIFH